MSLKIWGWDKKPRTLQRNIKQGDIFCFEFYENKYCFGRIIHVIKNRTCPVEVFDYISDEPTINEQQLRESKRLMDVFLLNPYCTFDVKSEQGEWRIIGRDEDYVPVDIEDVYFIQPHGMCTYDIYRNQTDIPREERAKYLEEQRSNPCRINGSLSSYRIRKIMLEKFKEKGIEFDTTKALWIDRENAQKKLEAKEYSLSIKPFIYDYYGDGASVVFESDMYKLELFGEYEEVSGYKWGAIAKLFIEENMPKAMERLELDCESGMFCMRSNCDITIKDFIPRFREAMDNEEIAKDLVKRATDYYLEEKRNNPCRSNGDVSTYRTKKIILEELKKKGIELDTTEVILVDREKEEKKLEEKEYLLSIKPFIYDDYGDGASVVFEPDMYKLELFGEDEEVSGHRWGDIAVLFIEENMPEDMGKIEMDCESGMFCMRSNSAVTIKNFITRFREAMDNEEIARDLIKRATEY